MKSNAHLCHCGLSARIIVIASLFVLGASPLSFGQDKISVVVSILPQKEFVENIGGQFVQTIVLVPPNASPESYEPNPAQMKELSRAKFFFKVGTNLDFELSLLDKIAGLNPSLRIVDCSKGINILIEPKGGSDQGEEVKYSGHHHGGSDPHIWSSLRNAQVIIDNITDGLIAVDSIHKAEYQKNAATYKQKLAFLDKQIAAMFANTKKRKFIVFHPAWGYFAKDYGLIQLAVEMEGKEPSAADIKGLILLAKENGITTVFASPQFNAESAKTIAREIGGTVEYIDPLNEHYFDNMQTVAGKIAKSLD
jgi:zinc transport system substrate-binding protein